MTKKSPFPGMDPFMERHWEDVHGSLIGYIRDALQPQLSEDLIARMEETVYVESDGEFTRGVKNPDVRIVESNGNEFEAGRVAAVVLDEPLLLEPLGDLVHQRSVIIYDVDQNRIITAVELLSPWNKKPGPGLEAYLRKREKYLSGEVNLIEIDLIRAGDWTTLIGRYLIPKEARTTYRVTVSEPHVSGVWLYPIPLRAKLPTIKVPLRDKDEPAKLNLQELLDKAYLMGRYYRMDYAATLVPQFSASEKQWVDQLLEERR